MLLKLVNLSLSILISILVSILVPGPAFPQGLPTAKPEDVGMSTTRLERIRPVMQAYVDQGKLPGMITAVARRGKVVHFDRLGMMDVEAGKKMRPDTIFRIYSMTKPITGVAMMILYEEGKYLLTDPVSNYLPEFENMKVYVGGSWENPRTEPARPMTIKHLLTHTSGLTYGDEEHVVPKLYKEAELWKSAALGEFIEKLVKLPLAAQPGTGWHYGVSMDVLGRLVEVLSGKSFDQFLAKRIFQPLGMVDTAFYVLDEKLERFAANYQATPEGGLKLIDRPQESEYRNSTFVPYGGQGLVSTAADYLRFAQMLANGGELDGVRILGRKTVDFMMLDHLGPELGPEPLGEAAGWYGMSPRGLGFGLTASVIRDVAQSSLVGSLGTFSWGGTAETHFWVDREEELIGLTFTQVMPSARYPIRAQMKILTYQAIID
ncbi:MAG: serine hydrolase domain-containing protein [Vicinamibacteria bacterium]